MTFISRSPEPALWLAAAILEAQNRPPTEAKKPAMAKTETRTRVTLIPARRDASTLPPSAKTLRPYAVRRSTKSLPTRTIAKSSTASGRPLYWLNMTATANAATASSTVRRMMSLSGRDGMPAIARRRLPRKADRKYPATATKART